MKRRSSFESLRQNSNARMESHDQYGSSAAAPETASEDQTNRMPQAPAFEGVLDAGLARAAIGMQSREPGAPSQQQETDTDASRDYRMDENRHELIHVRPEEQMPQHVWGNNQARVARVGSLGRLQPSGGRDDHLLAVA